MRRSLRPAVCMQAPCRRKDAFLYRFYSLDVSVSFLYGSVLRVFVLCGVGRRATSSCPTSTAPSPTARPSSKSRYTTPHHLIGNLARNRVQFRCHRSVDASEVYTKHPVGQKAGRCGGLPCQSCTADAALCVSGLYVWHGSPTTSRRSSGGPRPSRPSRGPSHPSMTHIHVPPSSLCINLEKRPPEPRALACPPCVPGAGTSWRWPTCGTCCPCPGRRSARATSRYGLPRSPTAKDCCI